MSPEEQAKAHQKAFRTAFDYLASHFPPGEDYDWWDGAGKDMSIASADAGDHPLARGLLLAVYNYLDEEFHERRKTHGETDR